MNIERMNALIDLIEAHPNDPVNFGAAHCIGGWMHRLVYNGTEGYLYSITTAELLGVDFSQATAAQLYWPHHLKQPVGPRNEEFPEARTEVLAMLRRWRDTGEISWDEKV